MAPLRRVLTPTQDAHVDQAAPDANHGDASQLHVRSDADANRRAYLEFDLAQLVPAGLDAIVEDVIAAELRAHPLAADPDRALELRTADGTFQEDTITWANQPGPLGLEDTHTPSQDTPHAWDVTEALRALGEGPAPLAWPCLLLDETEHATPHAQQTYASTRHATQPPLRLHADVTLRQYLHPTHDTYVDQATPTTPHADEDDVWITSDADENQRAYAQFPLQDVYEHATGFARVLVTATPTENDDNRELDANLPSYHANLETLTWDTQPPLVATVATHPDSSTTPHAWEGSLLGLVQTAWQDGDDAYQLAFQDANEDAGPLQRHQQRYPSTHDATPPTDAHPLRMEIVITDFTRWHNLPTHLHVAYTQHLPSAATPRFPRHHDLASTLTHREHETLFSQTTPTTHPIHPPAQARATGRTAITIPYPLHELEALLDEASTPLTLHGDEHTAIVQIIDHATTRTPPHRPHAPIHLHRGDAILYSLDQDDRYAPGTIVHWNERDWLIASLLTTELITDDATLREAALKRLATTHQARATGEIQQA